ncbi:bifunctional phosphoribosyl-AMP cyclohydrolase; phosphoribosyl-ATP pyrophosphohydrolase [Candidatus Hydrogenisulfobacillus filiaventi]|uniref:Histidine biosynthesis bifunctional protein HisIE n=1 Tax=Candidatus Hydrogenisulfobacillus filiaventi TaxID=2707344 RepID=A0A6F8ZEY3_9FIRM|nr:bifunctional phosphoribosyl-AMP cyclohydrolase; phosphoribosyl-ATP pyrophosphohydrolase [Candidatus Hydrogenisulfobacillus filiaventi]
MAVVLEEDGQELYPVVVQDAASGRVLMVAYANREALERTRRTGLAHFYSRSRKALWMKGETSGHRLPVEAVWADCDQDSFIYRVRPQAPVCHRGTPGCFDEAIASPPADLLAYLRARVEERQDAPAAESYTSRLLHGPLTRLVKKVVEEAGEVAIAALAEGREEQVWEAADLLYHLSVLLVREGIDLGSLGAELSRRHAVRHPAAPDAPSATP